MTSKVYDVTYKIGESYVSSYFAIPLEDIYESMDVVSIAEVFSTNWEYKWGRDIDWQKEWRDYWTANEAMCADME